MREVLVYGLSKEATQDWQEDLLACFPLTSKAQDNVEAVKQAASAQGFHSFRITGYSGEAPNFIKALNL